MIKTYFVPISYLLMSYILVFQGVYIMSIVRNRDKNAVLKSMIVLIIVSIAITIYVNKIPDIVKKPSTKYYDKDDFKKCEFFSKDELPMCRSFFGKRNKVLAAPSVTKDGESLTRRSILQIIAILNSYKKQ